MKNIIQKGLNHLSTILLIVVAGLTISLVIDKFNLFQIDTVGQLISSQFFRDIGFHQYNIHRFMGMINNLFYPPAQDFFSSVTTIFTGSDSVTGFRLYVVLLILFYFYSIFRLTKQLHTIVAKCIYVVLFILYFLIDKQNLTFLQGGGLIDIYFTGLNSQILGLSFVNLLCAEVLTKQRNIVLFSLSTLGILSHIVVIPIIGLILLYRFLLQRTLKNFLLGLGVIVTTSFFWFPFFDSRFLLTSANIVFPIPLFVTGITLLVLLMSYWLGNRNTMLVSLVGLTLILPSELSYLLSKMGLHLDLPSFHYYRFSSPVLSLMLFMSTFLLDKIMFEGKRGWKKQYRLVPLIALFAVVILFFKEFNITNWNRLATRVPRYETKNFDLTALEQVTGPHRIFVIDHKRSVDFNLDSLLQVYYPNLLFSKGLYWESHFSNEILTSYLANLLSSRDMIVNYFKFGNLSCENKGKLWNRFITRYGIGWLLVNHLGENQFLLDDEKKCINNILLHGTDQYVFTQKGKISINNLTYFLVNVTPRLTGSLDNSLISSLHDFSISLVDNVDDAFAFRKVLLDDINNNTGSFLYPTTKTLAYSGFEIGDTSSSDGIVTGISTLNNRLQWIVSGNNDTLTHVKFNRYPGVRILTSSGITLPTIPVIDGIIVRGSGEMILSYDGTDRYLYVYLCSIGGFILMMFYLLKSK